MDWHKAQNDPWAWEVFEVMTGPETGGYLIASGETSVEGNRGMGG